MAECQAGPSTQESSDLGGGDFMTEGINVRLSMTNKGLSWTSATDRVFLEWNDIIRCHRGLTSSKTPMVAPEESDKDVCFTLHHCEKMRTNVWKHTRRSFFLSEGNLEDILSTIQKQSKKDRSKSMLVVINPNAGEGKGEEMYKSVVAPLFHLAEINTHIIVSKSPNHLDQIGKTYDFSSVDSIVTVGGDGTLQKVLHTWIPRVQKEKGVDINDHHAEFKPLPCTVATIPTGTGNRLAHGNYGCDDVTTAALNIISGRKVPRKLVRATNDGKHVGFATVMLATGAWAETMDLYEKGRTQGFFWRQMNSIWTAFKKKRDFNVRVEYLPIETKRPSRGKRTSVEETSKPVRRIIEGLHTGIIAFAGLFIPNRDTGTSSMDMVNPGMTMVLDTHCGFFTYTGYISKVMHFKNDMFYNDFTNAKKVTSYRYKILNTEERSEMEAELDALLNFDGEMRQIYNVNSEIEVSYFQDILQMYGSVCIY